MRGIVVTLLVAVLPIQGLANPRVESRFPSSPFSSRELVDVLGAYSFRHLPSGDRFAHFDSILAESQSPEHGLQDDNLQLYLEHAASIEPLLRSLEAWSGAVLPSPRNGFRIRGPASLVDSLLSEDKRRAAAWVDKAKLARATAWVPGRRRRDVTSVDARFTSERVEISIYEGFAEVKARYFFTKERGTPLPMSFPFPEDSSLGRATLQSATLHCDDGGFNRLRLDDSSNAWFLRDPRGLPERGSVPLVPSGLCAPNDVRAMDRRHVAPQGG